MKLINALILAAFLAACGSVPDEPTVTEHGALCSTPHSDFNGSWKSLITEASGAQYANIATTITTPAYCDAGQIAMASPFASGFVEYFPNGGNLHQYLEDGQFTSIYGYTWVIDPATPCVHAGGALTNWWCAKMNVYAPGGAFVETATWLLTR